MHENTPRAAIRVTHRTDGVNLGYNGSIMATAGRVLFLCSGNYYRSRFAEILFNDRAATAGLAWQAESRGLSVGRGDGMNIGPISRHVIEGLRERGMALPGEPRHPKGVCETDFDRFGVVVALKEAEHRRLMQELFPTWAERVRYWHVHDVEDGEPAEAMAEIERLVHALIEELSIQPS